MGELHGVGGAAYLVGDHVDGLATAGAGDELLRKVFPVGAMQPANAYQPVHRVHCLQGLLAGEFALSVYIDRAR